ncbi:MAG TPA: hypothetical protein VJT75_10785, partial [Thermoleophilaceae bacterium]|nr:hypothetical protein [Thermoleophilaceae bacterium]
ASGFDALEAYLRQTLDPGVRFDLKLANPLGVGRALAERYAHASSGVRTHIDFALDALDRGRPGSFASQTRRARLRGLAAHCDGTRSDPGIGGALTLATQPFYGEHRGGTASTMTRISARHG